MGPTFVRDPAHFFAMAGLLKRPARPEPACLLTDVTFWPAWLAAPLWHAEVQRAKRVAALRVHPVWARLHGAKIASHSGTAKRNL
jgi:hypothetical protein